MPYHTIKKQRTDVNYRKIYKDYFDPISSDNHKILVDTCHIDAGGETKDLSNVKKNSKHTRELEILKDKSCLV
jgi:hypothetical protein